MRKVLLLAAVLFAMLASDAMAQRYGRYGRWGYGRRWGGYYGGGTVAGSYAHGMADVIRSRGQYELDNSAAAINYAEARKAEIENRYQATQAYFEIRKMNRDYRAKERGPRPTQEQLVRFAQAGKPEDLTDKQLDPYTGAIGWPNTLKSEQFDEPRKALDKVLSERALNAGALTDAQYDTAMKAQEEMLAILKGEIGRLSPNVYVAAKRFIESLTFEIRG